MSFAIRPPDMPDPHVIYERLLALPPFAELAEHRPDVAFIFRMHAKRDGNRVILGTCQLVPGPDTLLGWLLNASFGNEPVYLFTLDAEFWLEATDRQREALIFHEMKHCAIRRNKYDEPIFNAITGDPTWRTVGHDIEAFDDEVARYGAWKGDIATFLQAAGA